VTLQLAPELLSGFLLALVRSAAWVFVAPPFGTRMFPSQVKVGLAAAITISLGPKLAEQAVPLETVPLITAAVLQLAAGLALGFLGVLLFSAVQAAGGLIDLFGGFSAAQQLDPVSGTHTSIFGRFYHLLAITLLFAIDGHLLLVRGFLTSFEAAPFTDLSLEGLAKLVTGDLGLFFLAAVEIAAPLLAALFLAELALGLLARAAPQMNVFLLGLPLKILLTIGLAALAIPLLPDAVGSLLRPIVDHGLDVVGSGGG
jgi:flagellar biosynthetic protein FliR